MNAGTAFRLVFLELLDVMDCDSDDSVEILVRPCPYEKSVGDIGEEGERLLVTLEPVSIRAR